MVYTGPPAYWIYTVRRHPVHVQGKKEGEKKATLPNGTTFASGKYAALSPNPHLVSTN